ncbi:MAG: S1 family peptidase [Tenericutes bacterium]|nr:S1 family peptidase [Mycoplasmatota bacterium]
MKKVLILLLLVIFTFTSSISVNAESSITNFERSEQKQAQVLYEFDNLWINEKDSYLFSNSFAGAYFDENDVLHINFALEYMDAIYRTYNFSDQFEVGYAKYSIKEFEEAIEIISRYFSEYSISKISIDDITNSLVVTTKVSNENLKETLVNLLKIENIVIEFDTDEINTHYTYSVTNGDFFTIKNFGCTVGFAARNSDGDAGFVTAGHCITESGSDVGEDIKIYGSIVGDVDSFIFEDYSTADAAFVDLRGDWWYTTRWIPSKNLVFNNAYQYLNTSSSYPVVGTVIAYYGDYNHTSILYGEITTGSVSVIMSGTILYQMVETDIVTIAGDSGGPFVRTIYAGGGLYLKYVQGVLSGGNSTHSYYSTVYNIFDQLDLTAY